MVLPVRIELTTSALPRMRSTTELRQHDLALRGVRVRPALWRKGRRPSSWACVGTVDPPPTPIMDKKTEREKRLAEALRENLRRRKAQAREQDIPAPHDDETPAH